MSFTIPGIPGEFVSENDFYLKNSLSGKYLYYDGIGSCERDWSDADMARFQWMVVSGKVMTLDSSFVANTPACGCICNCGPDCTGCMCKCGCPRAVPSIGGSAIAPEPEPVVEAAPEPEPVVEAAPEPEAEEEDVPVARSAALIEEALNAKATETGAPTPDAPVEQEDEEVPDLE